MKHSELIFFLHDKRIILMDSVTFSPYKVSLKSLLVMILGHKQQMCSF